jgi:sjoegren syndrome nuclear autoantigen 1
MNTFQMTTDSPSKLQSFNNELVSTLYDLKEKREAASVLLKNDKLTKSNLEAQIAQLDSQLKSVNTRIESGARIVDEYDSIILQTEQAYAKIVSSSRNLLDIVKKQAHELEKN